METEVWVDVDGSVRLIEVDDEGEEMCVIEECGPIDNYNKD